MLESGMILYILKKNDEVKTYCKMTTSIEIKCYLKGSGTVRLHAPEAANI